jgi:uncharacterized delta-60 repeat protein
VNVAPVATCSDHRCACGSSRQRGNREVPAAAEAWLRAIETASDADRALPLRLERARDLAQADVAITANGAIVVVGTHAFGGAANLAVARYTSGGALDTAWTTDFGRSQSTYDSGEGVAIQADGRIVVVGSGAEQTQFGGLFTRDLQLARYESSGALDSSFSEDGRLETSLYADTLGYGVAVEGDGRIVAFGKAGGAFALARINTDGTLDGTFSDDGKQAHTYIGDLIVSLIAPDGSSYVLHNRAGGSTDNINQTYTTNLSSEPATGTWRLRVQDAAAADTGRIDSWTLNL